MTPFAGGDLWLSCASLENFDVHIDQGHRRRCDPWDAQGLAKGKRTNLSQLFDYFSGEAGDLAIIKPLGNAV